MISKQIKENHLILYLNGATNYKKMQKSKEHPIRDLKHFNLNQNNSMKLTPGMPLAGC